MTSTATTGGEPSPPVRHDAAAWLSLAAAPVFALMALVTGLCAKPTDILCSATPHAAVGGMTTMYALMSLAHLSPWLRRLGRGRANLG